MNIKKMKLAELKPAPYNPRTISEAALRGLSASIKRFGLVEPIIVNKRSGNVVGGHQRLKVLESEGVKETQVVIVDLDEAEEKALNVALNNQAIAGDFTADIQALIDELRVEIPEAVTELCFDELLEGLEFNAGSQPKEPDSSPQLGDLEYRVIIDCESEQEQYELLDRFEQEGLKCRALIS